MKCNCKSAPQYHKDDCPEFNVYGEIKTSKEASEAEVFFLEYIKEMKPYFLTVQEILRDAPHRKLLGFKTIFKEKGKNFNNFFNKENRNKLKDQWFCGRFSFKHKTKNGNNVSFSFEMDQTTTLVYFDFISFDAEAKYFTPQEFIDKVNFLRKGNANKRKKEIFKEIKSFIQKY